MRKDFPAEGQHEQTASCDRLQVNKSVRSFSPALPGITHY